MRACVLAVALAVLIGCGKKDGPPAQPSNKVEAVPTDVAERSWILTCEVTGRGDQSSSEWFSHHVIAGHFKNRGSVWVERVYLGTRVRVKVEVKSAAAGVQPGQYSLYGTLVTIDLNDRRAELTDCVFGASTALP